MSLEQGAAELPVPAQPAEAREEVGKLSQLRKQSWPGTASISKLPDFKTKKKKKGGGKKKESGKKK